MKRVIVALIVLGLAGFAVAGPLAPGVEVPESRYKEFFPDMPRDAAEMMGLWPVVKRDNIPDASEVAAPAYPGAVIIKLSGSARTGRSEYKGLGSVQMASTDAFDKVRDFYAGRLKGWNRKSLSSGKSVYWARAGTVEVNSRYMKEPHVRVTDFSALFGGGKMAKKLVPGSRTLIEIFYMPAD
ncbi:MAG: hypothetical protein ACE5GY_06535 [Thermodesulfobacteriota bacterium]